MRTVTRKLYSRRGTLLGTVTFPAHWDLYLRESGRVRFAAYPGLQAFWDHPAAEAEAMVQTGEIQTDRRERGAVRLWGLTLEQFEQIEGCSFAPGAGYIRSLFDNA